MEKESRLSYFNVKRYVVVVGVGGLWWKSFLPGEGFPVEWSGKE